MSEPELVDLAKEVADLKAKLEKETTGFSAKLKSFSVVLAFVAALFAVPKGIGDLWQQWYSRPNLHLFPQSYLTLSYDPSTKLLSFGSDFTISNTGSRLDIIQRATASLESSVSKDDQLMHFEDNDISFMENNALVNSRFTIDKAPTRSLTYKATKYLSDVHRNQLLQPRARWRLVFQLEDEFNKDYSLTYCFDISQSIIDEFASATSVVNKRFLNPSCE